MDQRVFYGFLERVGGSGRYQTIALVVWSAMMYIIGSTSFFIPFVFYQSNYQCPEGFANCKDYVCSLPADQRAPFIHNDLFSLPVKFGDYRCDNNVEIDRLQSFIYLGGVAGVIIGAFTNEIITKRMLLICTVVANIVGMSIALLGESLFASSVGLFISFAGCSIQFQMVQCYIAETVQQDLRAQHTMATYVFYSLGVTLNGLFFYWLKSWQTYIIILLPIFVIILLFLIFYIEETPFDLIINFTPQESLAVLKKIGVQNGREDEHKITLPELENVKREFQQNEENKEHDNISVLDLFRYKSLRTLTIVSLVLHYVTSFQFVAPELAVRNYSLNIYTNAIVIGFAELVASILCYFIIDHYARKKVIYITQAVCILTSVPIFIFFSCSDGNCSLMTKIIQTAGLTLFRFAATVAYNEFYMQQYEAFPNQIRGLALQIVCMPSYFAGVTLPQIITFCERTGISIVFTFVLCTIIIVAMMICLPETFGIPPPEIIEELKYEHHEVNQEKQQEKIKLT